MAPKKKVNGICDPNHCPKSRGMQKKKEKKEDEEEEIDLENQPEVMIDSKMSRSHTFPWGSGTEIRVARDTQIT